MPHRICTTALTKWNSFSMFSCDRTRSLLTSCVSVMAPPALPLPLPMPPTLDAGTAAVSRTKGILCETSAVQAATTVREVSSPASCFIQS